MRTQVNKGLIALLILCFLVVPLRGAVAQEADDGGGGKADDASETALPPEFWYFPEEVKEQLADDPLATELFVKAKAKKRLRRRTGAVLFGIGAAVVVGSAFVYLSSHDIGVPNDTGELVGAVGTGAGLLCFVLPGSILRGRPSKAEREYIDYMKTKYKVIPVVELPRYKGDFTRISLLSVSF